MGWSVYLVLSNGARDRFEGIVGLGFNAFFLVVFYAIYTTRLELARQQLNDGFVQCLYGGSWCVVRAAVAGAAAQVWHLPKPSAILFYRPVASSLAFCCL